MQPLQRVKFFKQKDEPICKIKLGYCTVGLSLSFNRLLKMKFSSQESLSLHSVGAAAHGIFTQAERGGGLWESKVLLVGTTFKGNG